jgi:hypothetical protein
VRLTGLVLSRAAVSAGDRLIASGAIAADSVALGHDGSFSFDTGFECSADVNCEDGNSCTTNRCVDGSCKSSVLANDTLCSTSESQSGTCQTGSCVAVPSADRVQEILTICTACHAGAQPSAGLDLTDIRAVRDNGRASSRCSDAPKIIAPGDVAGSYLFLKITDTPACTAGRTSCLADAENAACRLGLRMPRNLPPLPASEIEEVRQWIVAGAP